MVSILNHQQREFIVAALESKALLYEYNGVVYAAVLEGRFHADMFGKEKFVGERWQMSGSDGTDVTLLMDAQSCDCGEKGCIHVRLMNHQV
jgi:hypothetical protein